MADLEPYPFPTFLVNCVISPIGFFLCLFCLMDLLFKFRSRSKDLRVRKAMELSCIFVFGSGMFTFAVFFVEFYTFSLSDIFDLNINWNNRNQSYTFCKYFTPFMFCSICLFQISIFTYFILRIQHSFRSTVFAVTLSVHLYDGIYIFHLQSQYAYLIVL